MRCGFYFDLVILYYLFILKNVKTILTPVTRRVKGGFDNCYSLH